MSPQVYAFDKLRVFFKHTDYHGFVHPYNFLEWMSYVREAYFQDLVPNFQELCDRNIKMVTAEVEFELLNDAVFGDLVRACIYSDNVRRLSFDVVFEFFRRKDAVCLGKGRQKLTFIDAETGKPARIPEELRSVVVLYARNLRTEGIEREHRDVVDP